MPTRAILDILDQAERLGFSGGVIFSFYSEPLLNKSNIFLALEARKRSMKPFLHTNGDVLKNDDTLCQEVKNVYEYIVIGLYDYTTNDELERYKQFWHNKLSGANLLFSTIGPLGSRSGHNMGIPRALVPTDGRMSIPDLTYSNGPCSRPLIRMIIRYDGEMCICCEDVHADFSLGNIYQNSLEELWFSDYHVKITNDLLEGYRGKYTLCSNCPQSPTEPALKGKSIKIASRKHRVESVRS
jgi:radical SAM protein with 4Fe4S-binding SPASM domain